MSTDSKPGFEFAAGVLHIDTKLTKMRMRWHPQPLAEELIPGVRKWSVCWPEFRLLRPRVESVRDRFDRDLVVPDDDQKAATAKAAAFAAFRAELPDELVRLAEPFVSHQWALLCLLDKEPRAIDMARSNPVLTHALASSDLFRATRPETAAVQALWHHHHKQRQILAWLGFPEAEAVARVVRRIPPESGSPPMLRRLRNALVAHPVVLDHLTHVPVINATVMELVTHTRLFDFVTPKLLLDAAQTTCSADELSIGDMLLEALDILKTVAPGRRVLPFQAVRKIRGFYQEMNAEYRALKERREEARQEVARRAEIRHAELQVQRRAVRRERNAQQAPQRDAEARRRRAEQAEIRRRPYPTPPIPGTRDIEPITSVEQLKTEGVVQGNCVGTYAQSVKAGSLYVYRVMAPERATLSIRRDADGCWWRSEIKAHANRRVRVATVRAVEVWLDRYRISV